MKVIVIGCGRAGAELADHLFHKGHKVSVVDIKTDAFQNLHPSFRGRTIEGEALNRDVLRNAGIQEADGLAAMTNSDSTNVVICHIANTVYKTPRVVARNYDPHVKVLYELFQLQYTNSVVWAAQRTEEILYGSDIQTVFSAGNGEVEIYEINIPERLKGQPLQTLLSGEQSIPVSLTRSGKAILPQNDTLLEKGDIVHFSATLRGIQALRQRLKEVA